MYVFGLMAAVCVSICLSVCGCASVDVVVVMVGI